MKDESYAHDPLIPLTELENLLSKHMKSMEEAIKDMNAVHNRSRELVLARVLNKMDDVSRRHLEAGLKDVEHVATVPATSSSAWAALLHGHMETIQPTIEKWRGTLDTVLIFVALFSAVVTTFYVQAIQGLSEDPAIKTNQLIANLTDVVLSLRSTNTVFNLTNEPVPFEPENLAVRTTFYWSLSLIISISIASLAVTTRAFLAQITRSSHRQAYEKLTELRFRWEHAEKFLGPMIGILLQALVVPVLLFIVGLLDTIISASLPVTSGWRRIVLSCGLISCVVCVGGGMLALYTVIFGSFGSTHAFVNLWLWASRSSRTDQAQTPPLPSNKNRLSTFKIAMSWFGSSILRRDTAVHKHTTDIESASITKTPTRPVFWRKFLSIFSSFRKTPQHSSPTPAHTPNAHDEAVGRRPLLASKHHTTYHAIICTLHNDNILDQAIAALPSLIEDRKRAALPGRVDVEEEEIKTFHHLLSMDASAQCNLLSAKSLVASLTYDTFNRLPAFQFKPQLMIPLIDTLRLAGQRNATSGSEMALAALHLLESVMKQNTLDDSNEESRYAHHITSTPFRLFSPMAPLLGLLFVPFNDLKLDDCASELDRVRLQVLNLAYNGLVSDIMMRYKGTTHHNAQLSFLLSLYMRDMNVFYEVHDALRLCLISRDTPFLLSLNPTKLGHEMQTKPTESNYDCYRALLELIFTPGLLKISHILLVKGVRDVIEYHRDRFHGSPLESVDLFMETRDMLTHLIHASSQFVDEVDENGLPKTDGWEALVDTCVILVQFLFDPRHAPLLVRQFSPPLYFHQSVITALHGVQNLRKGSVVRLDIEFQDFLLAIGTGDRVDSNDYFEEDKCQLLDAFRMLDPTLPEWPLQASHISDLENGGT